VAFYEFAPTFLATRNSWIATQSDIVSSFCPVGYLPIQTAIAEAGEYWFSGRLAEIETAAAARAAKKDEPKTGVDALAWALSQPSIPEAEREIYADIWQPTEDRLRRLLHQGERLTAYYFGALFFPWPKRDST